MDYEQALIAAKSGNALLFLGSGFSYGLKSIVGHTLPTAKDLATTLCEKAEIRVTDDLKKASKKFLEKKSSADLVELLKDYFEVSETSENHKVISELPWLRVYTTNYDNVFEVSASKNKIRYQSLDSDDSPKGEILKKNVIHINGYIRNLNERKLFNTFKLTTKSYLTSLFRDNDWCQVLKGDIQVANAIFFVGYSLYDIEIQEILNSDENLKNKTFFIDRKGLSDLDIEDLDIEDFGTIKPIGIDGFANDILSISEDVTFFNSFIISNFTEIKLENHTTRAPVYKDIIDFLSFGKVDNELLVNDIVSSNRNRYLVKREEEDDSIKDLIQNDNVILYSDLANGKSVLSLNLSLLMKKYGYTTFSLNDFYDENIAYSEIEKIIKKYDKCIFLIENYTKNLGVISHINLARKSETKLLLLSRTIDHDRNYYDIIYNRNILEKTKTCEICLDVLTQNDVNSIVEYFDRYGVWIDRASYNPSEKKTFLVKDAQKELSSILLGVLDSPQIQVRINELFEEMINSKSIRITLISILCLNMSNIKNPTPNLISSLTKDNNINSSEFKSSASFANLIYKDREEYYFPKSSILAKHILQKFPKPVLLVETLIEICKNVRSCSMHNTDIYMQIYKDLVSYRNAVNIIPSFKQRESLITFYEGLREIKDERENPLFWLQYAMARISSPDEENLKFAKSHLDVALSLARKRPNFWVDDIKTQFSRYYIESACLANNCNLAFDHFKNSYNEIYIVLKGKKRKSHALRPIGKYITFYRKFKNEFSDEQREYILKVSEELIDMIKIYLPIPKRNDMYYNKALSSVSDLSLNIRNYNHVRDNI